MDMSARLDFNGFTSVLPFARGSDEERKAETPHGVVMKLDPYRAASLRARGAVDITCISGQLWITRLGDMDDIVLQAGQTRTLQHPVGDIVLSTAGARCPASFSIRPSAQSSMRWPFGAKAGTHFHVDFA